MAEIKLPVLRRITYHIDIIPERTGGFFVKIRELPGCLSQGETFNETMINISDAMNGWLKCCITHNDHIPLPGEKKVKHEAK